MMLDLGWPHDPAKISVRWPHEAANWQSTRIFYSLLEIAKLACIDSARYLREADARDEVLLPADLTAPR